MPGTPFPPAEADKPGPRVAPSPAAAALLAEIEALTPARPGAIGNQHPDDDAVVLAARRTAIARLRSNLEDSQRSVVNALAARDRVAAELVDATEARQRLAGELAEARGRSVRLPCFRHRWHDVPEVDVVVIVAALQAEVADMRLDPPELAWELREEPQAYPCPLDALRWGQDVEMCYEHCQQAVEMTGAWEVDEEEGGWKPTAARDPRPNGTDSVEHPDVVAYLAACKANGEAPEHDGAR